MSGLSIVLTSMPKAVEAITRKQIVRLKNLSYIKIHYIKILLLMSTISSRHFSAKHKKQSKAKNNNITKESDAKKYHKNKITRKEKPVLASSKFKTISKYLKKKGRKWHCQKLKKK